MVVGCDSSSDCQIDDESQQIPGGSSIGVLRRHRRKDDNVDDPDDDQENNDDKKKYRQWLYDRMFGKAPPPKPPSWFCYIPPCISLCPDLLEQNRVCETTGGIGKRLIRNVDDSKGLRKHIMAIGIAANLIAMLLSIVACFSISVHFNVLQKLPFSSGRIFVTDNKDLLGTSLLKGIFGDNSSRQVRGDGIVVTADIGLRAVAYGDLPNGNQDVWGFDEFCDYNGTGLETFIMPDDCNGCADVSVGLVFTIAMSAFPYIPSMFTNVIRMYANYDINCLKSFGVFATSASLILALYTYLAYKYQCFSTFYSGDIYLDLNDNTTLLRNDADNAILIASVEWYPGNGFICILVATVFSAVDILCHLILPSPSIARNRQLQKEYELQHMNASGVTEKVSYQAFIQKYFDMICQRKSKRQDEAER